MHQRDFSPPVIQCSRVRKVDGVDDIHSEQIAIATQDCEQCSSSSIDILIVSDVPYIPRMSDRLRERTEPLGVERPLPPSDHSEIHDGLLLRKVG
ncbi:hypothetical protein IAQ61_010343 [Plenodomus lingam]|uniref:uncharacterized protein n=1 Tax=Leptosphaeria maculans TaxID=5022 RepID=UPI003329785D|nr:hypothetical protein IAQ61_010343 [Plenodomus lingam]